ncbi:MAG: DUF975 family protein [Verrucomicrobia bacterium]|nr:DUF975 family protein [Verrucomicrobiota bacterium]MDA1087351.1 DUF975 family protein [Verrucomicrobiota bacterium]
MPWYYVENGESVGPVADANFDAAVTAGKVTDETLVWQEGMADWLPYAQVRPEAPAGVPADAPATSPCAECAETFATDEMIQYNDAWICAQCKPVFLQRLQEGAPPPAPMGGLGQTHNADLNRTARSMLQGNWGVPIGVCFLKWAIETGVSQFISLLVLFLTAPLTLGSASFFVKLTAGDRRGVEELFSGFRNYGRSLSTLLLMSLIVYGWALLTAIPCIILFVLAAQQDSVVFGVAGGIAAILPLTVVTVVGLMYGMVFYILAERPTLGCSEVLRQSRFMTQGVKWKLYCLHWRFVGWALLCIPTLFIGLLWLMPYYSTAIALFYHDTKGRLAEYA